MEKKRHLELAVVKSEWDQITFRIAEQTHFGKDFCQKGKVFKAKNGISIASLSKTIIGGISPKDEEYKCRIDNFIWIMEAVTEYNETDGKGYEKPWPQNGSDFYYVGTEGVISKGLYRGNSFWEKCVMFGNFFRTREEAEAALERVKKALKGVL